MGDWKEWSDWIREGYFISYEHEGVRCYEHVISRDFAHWVLMWDSIASGQESGPTVPPYLEITKGYDRRTNTNQFWQLIFGIVGQVYVYIELPTDLHRHGIPKLTKPSSADRAISHFEEWMSPYLEPTFITEHIMMRPGYDRINISMYNPTAITITPRLNFMIAKFITERVGTQEGSMLLTPTVEGDPADPAVKRKNDLLKARWQETLEKLYKRQIPHRPLTLEPVRAPAEAAAGD